MPRMPRDAAAGPFIRQATAHSFRPSAGPRVNVVLLHNPGAGSGSGGEGVAALARTIRAEGHALRLQSTHDKAWKRSLDEPIDLVAVLGGDGTVGRVAKHMLGRGVPLAAFAAGTANNIALTLGIEGTSAQAQVASWSNPRRLTFDAAVAHGPFGSQALIEGLGCGLLVWGMRRADGDMRTDESRAARMARVLAMLMEQSAAHPAVRVEATLDGRDLSGDYLLLEAMNTQFIGPNLFLAPSGHPGDGLLDVVTVASDAREAMRERLATWQRGALQPSEWPTRQGKQLVLQWTGFPLHLDDEVWPEEGNAIEGPARIQVSMQPGALEFWVPQETEHPPVP
jgi:diacylglycerol kinase family enzyme